MSKIVFEGKELTRDEFLEELALGIKGNANADSVRGRLSEAEELLDTDSEEILEILAKDYDCHMCMNCTVYHELSEIVAWEGDEVCRDCAEAEGYENGED